MRITPKKQPEQSILQLIRSGLPVLLFIFGVSPLIGQKIWKANDGEWTLSSNWNSGVPAGTNTANSAVFQVSAESLSSQIEVTLDGTAHQTGAIRAGLGKSVTLEMADGASLSTGSWWRVGENIGDGSGSGHITVNGPESGDATIQAGFFHVGSSSLGDGGNTLTFSGNLTVLENSTDISAIGRVTNNNTMTVSQGASVTRHSLSISPSNTGAGRINNGLVVQGTDSKVTIDGGIMLVGDTAEGRSNYVTVTNHGTLEVLSGQALRIGNSSGFGGNHVTINDGGTLTATGSTTISGFSVNGGDNDGNNRLSILSGGTYSSSGSTNVTGVLQLAAGGVFDGNSTVSLTGDGRFEVAGSGLAETVVTNINEGTLAIGLTGAEAASELTLNSEVSFSDGATLELNLFSSAADGIDRIAFGESGELDLTGSVILDLIVSGYVPVVGDSWIVFSGDTEGIVGSGQLDLSSLDPTLWDTSQFNETGGWQLTVIPEPSTSGYVVAILVCLGLKKVGRKAYVRRGFMNPKGGL